MIPPVTDQDLGFRERIEYLAIKQLVAQLAVEAGRIEELVIVA